MDTLLTKIVRVYKMFTVNTTHEEMDHKNVLTLAYCTIKHL